MKGSLNASDLAHVSCDLQRSEGIIACFQKLCEACAAVVTLSAKVVPENRPARAWLLALLALVDRGMQLAHHVHR